MRTYSRHLNHLRILKKFCYLPLIKLLYFKAFIFKYSILCFAWYDMCSNWAPESIMYEGYIDNSNLCSCSISAKMTSLNPFPLTFVLVSWYSLHRLPSLICFSFPSQIPTMPRCHRERERERDRLRRESETEEEERESSGWSKRRRGEWWHCLWSEERHPTGRPAMIGFLPQKSFPSDLFLLYDSFPRFIA